VVVLAPPALLLAWLVPIDPASAPAAPAWEIAASRVETLRFHLGLLTAASAALLLAARARRTAALGILVTAWAILPALMWPADERTARAGAPSLRVLSVNLAGPYAQERLVMREIEAAEPDLLVLQEYTSDWRTRIGDELTRTLPFRHERPREDNFGMAIFSRRRWRRLEDMQLAASGTPQVRMVFDLDGQSIVAYALHLMPPVRVRYEQHRAEFADLLGRLETESGPTLLIGDFNFVDHGALARALHARGFVNAHRLAGGWRGATWPAHEWLRHVPGIRIDHVYLGAGLTSTASWVGDPTGSDHLPVATVVTASP
jgi:endonuclease/exonuclease/phosphatase (EEP) superfamily protein YafD